MTKPYFMLHGCGENGDQTIRLELGPRGEFSSKELGIARGQVVVAADAALEPTVLKGSKLLVDLDQAEFTVDDVYVFDRGPGVPFDIAEVKRLEDGSFLYVSDIEKPEHLADLSGRHVLGRVVDCFISIPMMREDEPLIS
ncbi:hypothetical protein [Sutterella sp.]|uniref:hypothetical protein n=1 Tax=Sutterella sp. TaxID=1981025 RepID=UPI0026DF6E16|nr:hypothetical protein [Sutterella sp.]MDO5532322.1 hypothetical protein [Sutterella sp.]